MKVLDQAFGSNWALYNGDSVEVLPGLPSESIDLAVFSPPFQALYVYSPTERDLGNCRTPEEFFEHLGFITRELARLMKPGQLICVHCAQITAQKVLDGYIGLKDFRGRLIDHYTDAGFVYHGEICIDKDPQAQAIRTHAKGLLFVQKRKDRSWLRPGLADYILVFRAGAGDPAVPIRQDDITDDQWIEWARPIWYGIRETDTLQAPQKANEERHIAPLQLGVIERCVRLWSNPGETVLSPFAGIGSELHEAVRLRRKAVGVELNPGYFAAAVKNLRMAESRSEDMFIRGEVAVGEYPPRSAQADESDIVTRVRRDAFLDDLEALYRKHGLGLGHEDYQGGFIVEPLTDYLINWTRGALIQVAS